MTGLTNELKSLGMRDDTAYDLINNGINLNYAHQFIHDYHSFWSITPVQRLALAFEDKLSFRMFFLYEEESYYWYDGSRSEEIRVDLLSTGNQLEIAQAIVSAINETKFDDLVRNRKHTVHSSILKALKLPFCRNMLQIIMRFVCTTGYIDGH